MKIVGVVHYYAPTLCNEKTGQMEKTDTINKENFEIEKDLKPIGHFVAIALRTDGSWILYDDARDREKRVSKNFPAEVC